MRKQQPRITGHPEWVSEMKSSNRKAVVEVLRPLRISGKPHTTGERLKLDPEVAFEVTSTGRATLLN